MISHTMPIVVFFTQKNQSSDTKSQVTAKIKQPVLLSFHDKFPPFERNYEILLPTLE